MKESGCGLLSESRLWYRRGELLQRQMVQRIPSSRPAAIECFSGRCRHAAGLVDDGISLPSCLNNMFYIIVKQAPPKQSSHRLTPNPPIPTFLSRRARTAEKKSNEAALQPNSPCFIPCSSRICTSKALARLFANHSSAQSRAFAPNQPRGRQSCTPALGYGAGSRC